MPRLRTGDLLAEIREFPRIRALLEWADGHQLPPLFLVGGAVRDTLLNGVPVDLDIAVEGPVAELTNLLDGLSATHDRFGTATLDLDGIRVDMASTRSESYPQPGALPAVDRATIAEDLKRRDFTVNAIAVALTGPAAGEVIQFPGALSDLEAGRLRVLHERSFEDDPTRLLRLARYQARLAFQSDAETLQLAHQALAKGALRTVSGNRIGNELRLLAVESDPVAALTALTRLGIAAAIHPRFGLGAGPEIDQAQKALALLVPGGRRDLVALASAATRVPEGELRSLLDTLAFSAPDREKVIQAASQTASISERLGSADRASEVDRALAGVSLEALAMVGATMPEPTRRKAQEWVMRDRERRLEIDGSDLRDAGLVAGPALGAGLAAARAALLDGEAPTRERQLQVAVEAAARAQEGLG